MIAEICTASVVNHTPLVAVEGVDALKEYETRIHAAFPDFDDSFEALVVEGARVAMRLRISGVHQGPFMDIEPTGPTETFGNTIFHRMTDGRIAERWVHPDVLGILIQLSAIDRPT